MDATPNSVCGRLKILVLYDDWTAQTAAVYDQLQAFRLHSMHSITYAVGTGESTGADDCQTARRLAAEFDVIIVHHSVRLYVTHYINRAWAEVLASFTGYKILFVQDDYERTETTRQWIEKLGFDALFSVVPEESLEKVYPRSRFPKLEKQSVLTGYVPRWVRSRQPVKPIAERSRFIGYRAFKLPYYFGDLAREKFVIGQRMREICEARGIAVDIEWEPGKRIYGESWFNFVEDCRATLGTESGSNVFDEDGLLEKGIREALDHDPDLGYEQIHERFLKEHEGKVMMNQVSPRIFEAIALGSALVLFEGGYSGVVRPHEHFIPLKKDFSNVDEVLEKLRDTAALETMTRRAYGDIIESGLYSYEAFVSRFDTFLSARVTPRPAGDEMFWLSVGHLELTVDPQRLSHLERQLWLTSQPFTSSENSRAFLSGHGSRLSESEIVELETKLQKSQSEEMRLTADFDFLQSEVARLTEKAAGLVDARKKSGDVAEALTKTADILGALAESRRMSWLRALGLCGPPPRIKGSRAEEYLPVLIEYIQGNRWLSRMATTDARLAKATGTKTK